MSQRTQEIVDTGHGDHATGISLAGSVTTVRSARRTMAHFVTLSLMPKPAQTTYLTVGSNWQAPQPPGELGSWIGLLTGDPGCQMVRAPGVWRMSSSLRKLAQVSCSRLVAGTLPST